MKLSHKILISFILAIIISLLIISTISRNMIDNRFNVFLVNELDKRLDDISREINLLYEENDYKLSQSEINNYANLENVVITIKNLKGESIYSSILRKNKGHGMGMGSNGGHGHNRRNISNISTSDEDYEEREFPLIKESQKIGTIIIGFINDSYLTENAILFKETLNRSFLISGFITIILSMVISIFVSRSLTKPLIGIRDMSNEISQGNYQAKNQVNTSTKEILEISNTIESLGKSLSEQENIRNKYASDISHELRTPITTIKGHLEAIQDGIWDASDEHLGVLISEVDRLSSLVSDLNKSFSAENFETTLDKTYFSISDELNEIVMNFEPLFKKNGYSINKNIEENLYIKMDKDKLDQVMVNLLSNSLKYLNTEGQVNLSLKSLENYYLIEVQDNGTGIKKKDLPHVFSRFYRADDSRSKKTGGSGIGLSIVKSFIEAHKGSITMDSIYGEGTTVKIKLPKNID